ncbi:hypothetical protein [Robbsia andropogonis]|uniref:hypothetical protein n=1 Tax=Robbsia andropogonis TaxID=28092 RepID=UPI000463747F|nr:hypothetical protein [Robbsia andropogonis]
MTSADSIANGRITGTGGAAASSPDGETVSHVGKARQSDRDAEDRQTIEDAAHADDADVAPRRATGRGRLDRAWRRMYAAALKSLFRATHSAEHRHSERLWPHGKVFRDAEGRVTDFTVYGHSFPLANDAMRRQRAYRERGTSAMCEAQGRTGVTLNARPPLHLVACGPSIAAIDYDVLVNAAPSHKRMGVNGAVALTRQYGMHFDYYCITDNGFIRHREDLVAHIIAQDLVLFTTPICLWTILQRFPQSALQCRVFLIERVGMQALRPHESYAEVVARSDGTMTKFVTPMPLGFSHDIARGVFPGGTVAFEALQVATWLDYDNLYLHGLDLGNAAEKPRFYETDDDRLPTMIHRQLAGEILPSFTHAAPILRARRVRVTNLSLESALDHAVFPKADWRTLPFVLAHEAIKRARCPAGVTRGQWENRPAAA